MFITGSVVGAYVCIFFIGYQIISNFNISASQQEEIKCHPFFKTIDWQLLYDKKIDPPYNPNVVSVVNNNLRSP